MLYIIYICICIYPFTTRPVLIHSLIHIYLGARWASSVPSSSARSRVSERSSHWSPTATSTESEPPSKACPSPPVAPVAPVAAQRATYRAMARSPEMLRPSGSRRQGIASYGKKKKEKENNSRSRKRERDIEKRAGEQSQE